MIFGSGTARHESGLRRSRTGIGWAWKNGDLSALLGANLEACTSR